MNASKKAVAAEVILACLLVGYGTFSSYSLVLLLLLASQSLWIRGRGWADLGLARQGVSWRGMLAGVVAAAAVVIVVRIVIAPLAIWVTAQPIDLSGLITAGDSRALAIRLVQAWTLAAFGEEMVFRGYLLRRTVDLVGNTPLGWAVALGVSSTLFGLAHRYQGWSGAVATTSIGAMLGLLFLASRKNLWAVIICHAIVDTFGLAAIYLGRGSLVLPD